MAVRKTVAARRKVGKVMKEYKAGRLKSGGRRTVTSPKQAVAIAMSEAGLARKRGKARSAAPGARSARSSARPSAKTKARSTAKRTGARTSTRKTAAKRRGSTAKR